MFGSLKDWRRVATRYDRCPRPSSLPWLSPQPSSSGSDQGVLTLALACCRLANLVDRAQQIGGERAAAGADVGGDRHAGGEGDLRTSGRAAGRERGGR